MQLQLFVCTEKKGKKRNKRMINKSVCLQSETNGYKTFKTKKNLREIKKQNKNEIVKL